MTPIEKEPLKTKICPSCGKEKPITSYYKTKAVKSGFSSRCKMCQLEKVNRVKNVETGKVGKKTREDGPALFNVSKKDWEKTFLFLQEIGYDLKKDIHLQFCEKHNFEPSKRGYEKSLIYSPKDLNMI
jgi:hypothetical protein